MSAPTRRVGVVAGLSVCSNRDVEHPLGAGPFDGELTVLFEADAPERPRADWFPIDDGRTPQALLRSDGRVVRLGPVLEHDVAVQVRRVVPFAAALQGKVVLHAAGVRWGGSAVAFVGESGAGKSTLAAALGAEGLDVLSDDLLPCRREGGRVVVFGDTDAGARLPLGAIVFLERRAGLDRSRRARLSKTDALRALLRHGFGEVRAPRAWDAQFRLYGAVADAAPAWRLDLPDELSSLPSVARALAEGGLAVLLDPATADAREGS